MPVRVALVTLALSTAGLLAGCGGAGGTPQATSSTTPISTSSSAGDGLDPIDPSSSTSGADDSLRQRTENHADAQPLDPRCAGLRVVAVSFLVGRPVDARSTSEGCTFTARRGPGLVITVSRQPLADVTGGLDGAVTALRDAVPDGLSSNVGLLQGGYLVVGPVDGSRPDGALGVVQTSDSEIASVSVKQDAPRRALGDSQLTELATGMLAMLAGLA